MQCQKLTSFSLRFGMVLGLLGLLGARDGLVSQAQELFISIVLFQQARQIFFGAPPFRNRWVQQNSQKIFWQRAHLKILTLWDPTSWDQPYWIENCRKVLLLQLKHKSANLLGASKEKRQRGQVSELLPVLLFICFFMWSISSERDLGNCRLSNDSLK